MNRRQFIQRSSAIGIGLGTLSSLSLDVMAQNPFPDVIIVKEGEPAQLVQKAVEELGGMQRFVKKGQTVLIKPNIAWDRNPEQAANTNPEAVAQVVRLCLAAGADKVRVLDRTCNQARRCYNRSGIEEAAKKAGAQVRHIIDLRFDELSFPKGEMIKSWPVYRDALDADVIINMPIIKHHSISGVTAGLKNIMGLLGGERGDLHKHFNTKIVDINTEIVPALTIADAYRILLRNGPSGGNLADVKLTKTVIAGVDRVAVDAQAVQLLGLDPMSLDYLQIAEKRGLGILDPGKVKVKSVTL